MYRAASSRCSSSGIASSSARSSSIWRSNSSRWLCIEMYSPAAIENAPASRPAIPASRMKLGLAARRPRRPSPGTGSTRGRRETPKMIARSVPERALRCQRSAPVIALGGRGRPASTAGWSDAPSRARPPRRAGSSRARPLPLAPRRRAAARSRRARARRRRSPRCPGCRPGCRRAPPRRPRAPSRGPDTARVPNTRAVRMISRTRARGRPAGGHGGAHLAQPGRPDVRVTPLVGRDVPEGRGPPRVLLDRRQRGRTGRSHPARASGSPGSGRCPRRQPSERAAAPAGLDSRHDRPAAAALPRRART